jgi:superfamily II DNA or RNA helicase
MRIIIDTLDSEIQTDNTKLLDALYKLYSFKVKGCRYSPAFKKRHWDGFTHFITKTGKFKTGLLDKVLEDLKKIDCTPELSYTYDPVMEEAPGSLDVGGFSYYDYQSELIELALAKKRCVIKSPTGSGKTLIMAGMLKALIKQGRKTVILFNAKLLLTQTYDFLTKVCGFDNIGLCFGEGYINGDTMLCTVQSIERIIDTHIAEAEVLMVDECHEFCNGPTTLAAIQSFPKAQHRYGFTATPPNEPIPLHSLQGAFGAIIETVTTSDLVESGHLTKPIIQLIKRERDPECEDDTSYLEVYDRYIVNNEERNNKIKEIVDDIKANNKQPRVLILTKSLAHGRALEKLLGGHCEFLEGAKSLGERYQSISRFRGHSGPSVLIGTKIMQTGVNIEEITHLINARGMKSEIATLQALGRALRKHKSKDQVYIYDFLDQEKYLKAHSLSRKRHYKKEGHEINIL